MSQTDLILFKKISIFYDAPYTLFFFFFFFSSRRRHTRFDCDWSSDVCSSDLVSGTCCSMSRSMTPFPKWIAPGRCPLAHSLSSRVDRKSTRLNSSHSQISYAVFCLKKKKKKKNIHSI